MIAAAPHCNASVVGENSSGQVNSSGADVQLVVVYRPYKIWAVVFPGLNLPEFFFAHFARLLHDAMRILRAAASDLASLQGFFGIWMGV